MVTMGQQKNKPSDREEFQFLSQILMKAEAIISYSEYKNEKHGYRYEESDYPGSLAREIRDIVKERMDGLFEEPGPESKEQPAASDVEAECYDGFLEGFDPLSDLDIIEETPVPDDLILDIFRDPDTPPEERERIADSLRELGYTVNTKPYDDMP